TGFLGCAFAVATLEGAGDREMVCLQARQRQHREHSLAYEVVAEPESILAGGGQEVTACSFVDRVAELMARQLAEGFEQPDVEVSADDRGGNQHPLGGRAH